MKTRHDPRHQRRIRAVKALFAHSFHPEQTSDSKLAAKIIPKLSDLDQIIAKCAPEWPLEQINRLDLSVLRLAVFELLYKQDTPPKVVIDEAVELGKEFGSTSSGSFINGVLASALKETGRLDEVEQAELEPAPTPDSDES